MKSLAPLLVLVVLLVDAGLAGATDTNGPEDCSRTHTDYGDAPPSGAQAYPGGATSHFPSCPAGAIAGLQQTSCPPISIQQNFSGWIVHTQGPDGYWLGCYPTPSGPMGIDSESTGASCAPTQCVEGGWASSFSQDECYGDGSDAGIPTPVSFAPCTQSTISFYVTSCSEASEQTPRYLNICVDWNEDGDWEDNFLCPAAGTCAYEWAVKNAPISIPVGCTMLSSPTFLSGPDNRRAWMRVTITDAPVADDFPTVGSAANPGNSFVGGETEDYPVNIGEPTSVARQAWGGLKVRYR